MPRYEAQRGCWWFLFKTWPFWVVHSGQGQITTQTVSTTFSSVGKLPAAASLAVTACNDHYSCLSNLFLLCVEYSHGGSGCPCPPQTCQVTSSHISPNVGRQSGSAEGMDPLVLVLVQPLHPKSWKKSSSSSCRPIQGFPRLSMMQVFRSGHGVKEQSSKNDQRITTDRVFWNRGRCMNPFFQPLCDSMNMFLVQHWDTRALCPVLAPWQKKKCQTSQSHQRFNHWALLVEVLGICICVDFSRDKNLSSPVSLVLPQWGALDWETGIFVTWCHIIFSCFALWWVATFGGPGSLKSTSLSVCGVRHTCGSILASLSSLGVWTCPVCRESSLFHGTLRTIGCWFQALQKVMWLLTASPDCTITSVMVDPD